MQHLPYCFVSSYILIKNSLKTNLYCCTPWITNKNGGSVFHRHVIRLIRFPKSQKTPANSLLRSGLNGVTGPGGGLYFGRPVKFHEFPKQQSQQLHRFEFLWQILDHDGIKSSYTFQYCNMLNFRMILESLNPKHWAQDSQRAPNMECWKAQHSYLDRENYAQKTIVTTCQLVQISRKWCFMNFPMGIGCHYVHSG